MPQYKSKRPSLENAHQYHKKGTWTIGPEDRFTAKERVDAIVAAKEEITKKCHDHLPRTRNLDLLILKCHIIIEFALETYIRALSAGNLDDKEFEHGWTFARKVNIAFMLGLGVDDPILLPSIQLLNGIRNDIAHSLTFKENKLDELLRVNSDDYHEKSTFTQGERLRRLKSITWFTCGKIAGSVYWQVLCEQELAKDLRKT